MKLIEETINNLLNGSSVADEIDNLISERVVCRYVGRPMRRQHSGKVYYVRKRKCTGQASPFIAQRAKRALRPGSVKSSARKAQRTRWRIFKPTPLKTRRLPGQHRSSSTRASNKGRR